MWLLVLVFDIRIHGVEAQLIDKVTLHCLNELRFMTIHRAS